jgi:hypothetical protein
VESLPKVCLYFDTVFSKIGKEFNFFFVNLNEMKCELNTFVRREGNVCACEAYKEFSLNAKSFKENLGVCARKSRVNRSFFLFSPNLYSLRGIIVFTVTLDFTLYESSWESIFYSSSAKNSKPRR